MIPYYARFWCGDTLAMHYGFAEHATQPLAEQLINTNRFLVAAGEVAAGDRVLDAGCGIGGSAIWLASTLGAQVTGITISPKQLAVARAHAARAAVQEHTSFLLRDYTDTGLAGGSFDVFWAIESACYADNLGRFAREAWRVLAPTGRLVIADGFLEREPATEDEHGWYRSLLDGWVLSRLRSASAVVAALAAAGFRDIRVWDKSSDVLPSARALERRCRLSYHVTQLGQWMGLLDPILMRNNLAGQSQYQLLRAGVASYRVIAARK
jgi:cyclopropane fatty-acyl-phospholipid synthase-like methyltransferase